jgi:hypothetical protein
MRWIGSAALCVALLTAVARAGTSADCGAPATLSDGWPVSTPAQQTLDATLICATGPSLAKLTGANPHGAVVVRNGVLVYEQYFAGDDMRGSTWLGVYLMTRTPCTTWNPYQGRRSAIERHRVRPWLAQKSRCPSILVRARIR